MISEKKNLILRELEEGTGAAVSATEDFSGLRAGLRIWFSDFEVKHGPVAEMRAYGLRGHRVELTFGNFSGMVLDQIQRAQLEDIQLARALIKSIRPEVEVTIADQTLTDWTINSGAFRMTAKVRDQARPLEDSAIVATCRDVIVPMMAAMAELIGYDVIDDKPANEIAPYEGAILASTVKRRERNPRNRLLCIRLHGEKCIVCGVEPQHIYGEAGSIIEVHHLEPLATLTTPRPYDPETDLVPLCPNCHRAVHTRRPIPWGTDELRKMREELHG
ncbi:HNH endonuclease [Rugamonas sp. FT107W]|uniref:HNH endonuclease n=1 Tax=Duganella vulcania TaxID=2692166 RepID=A0A845HKK2_9BURK|nr:HNH endonuclease [Duganella vulcania]MYN17126.1 HNH endonuclease [Duganella vulcania]